MFSSADQSKWSRIRSGHKVAKAAVGFAVAVIGLLAALVELGLVDPFGSDQTALASAAVKTSDAGSARVDLSRTIEAGQERVVEQARGEIDFRAETASLDFSNGLSLRVIKPYAYVLGTTADPVWCRYDLSFLGRGVLFGALTGFENDPAAALVNLEEHGTYEEVGEESLFGVETTRYSGHVDLTQLAEEEDDPELVEVLRQMSDYNDGRLPVDVWISSDELVRRLAASFAVPGEGYDIPGRVRVELNFDFSDFGTRVDVDEPPLDSVAVAPEQGCPETI